MALPTVGGGEQIGDGNLNEAQIGYSGSPSTATATATLTTSQSVGLLVANPSTTAATYTTPTGTAMDAVFTNAKIGSTFVWIIVNLGTSSGAVTVAGGTGVTFVGNLVVPIATATVTGSAQFRFRRTGTGAWTAYRIA